MVLCLIAYIFFPIMGLEKKVLSEFLTTQHCVGTEFACMKIVPFGALCSSERMSIVLPFLLDNCGFRLAIL